MDNNFLRDLAMAHGACGYEEPVAKVFYEFTRDSADEFVNDNLGSLMAVHNGTEDFKVLIGAHMDELSYLVKFIDDAGYIHIRQMGGWKIENMYAEKCIIKTHSGKEVLGVFGSYDADSSVKDDKDASNMVVDIGVDNKQQALDAGICIGDPIVPFSSYERMTNPKYVMCKAMDDRIGIAIAGEVIKRLKGETTHASIYSGGTVQEELGARGAKTIAQKVAPDIAFAVDVCYTSDIRGREGLGCIKLGAGTVLCFIDSTFVTHVPLFYKMKDICDSKNIPYQLEVAEHGGTDSYEFCRVHGGVVNMTISIPSRYMHSPNTIIHEDDVNATIDLLVEFCKNITMDDLNELRSHREYKV